MSTIAPADSDRTRTSSGEEKTVEQCLRPLITSMRLFGLYFDRRPNDSKSRKWNPWMIYSVFALALLWINAVRMFSSFTSEDRFGLILLNKVIHLIWMTQCAVSQTAFYVTSHLGKLQDVFLKRKLSVEGATYLRRIAVLSTIVSWSIFGICSVLLMYAIFFTDGFTDIMLAPLQTYVAMSNLLAPRIILYAVNVFLLAAHIFPQVMTFLLAMFISFRFRRVNAELERSLDAEEGRLGDYEIDVIRRQHQEIAMSVSNIDDCLMLSNASAFCCQLAIVIACLYTLIFYHSCMSTRFVVASLSVWMIFVFIGLSFTAAGGIMINNYVSESNAA